jgi:hypothetical protein
MKRPLPHKIGRAVPGLQSQNDEETKKEIKLFQRLGGFAKASRNPLARTET